MWVAAWSNNHGISIYHFNTEADAIQCVYNYVKAYWSEVAGGVNDNEDIPDEIPEEQNKAIKMYFNNHPDGEMYTIEKAIVSYHKI